MICRPSLACSYRAPGGDHAARAVGARSGHTPPRGRPRPVRPGRVCYDRQIGNVLGSTINWLLGRYLIHFQDRCWFPIKGRVFERARHFYRRWGVWMLLLAWTPVIGDPLTLVAGIFRTSLWVFLPLVTIGKAIRYLAIVIAV